MNPRPTSPDLADRARFEQLYASCHRAVLGYVLRRVTHPEDGADVIAETFLVAWRRLDEVPEGEGARLWLYGVARRTLANQRRGERRRTALADRLRSELAAAPVAEEHQSHLREIADALTRLSEGERELLRLEGWEGLDARQIATVLGISQNAVRIRLHRARRRLARALAALDHDTVTYPTAVRGETR
jgi:RNA polymerase sigma factor (sigma-70 family)